MTPRKTALWISLLCSACFAAGLVLALSIQDPASNSDLNPGRASNCETAISQAIDVLDDESLPNFVAEDIEAFGTLSPSCMTPGVFALINPRKVDVLDRTRERALAAFAP